MIDPTITLDDWRAWNWPFESEVPHLYLDCEGIPTCAAGCAVFSVGQMVAIDWARADGSPATAAEKATEYETIRGMLPAKLPGYYGEQCTLHLADEATSTLIEKRFDANARLLLHAFPDLLSWPEKARRATYSIAWAEGAGFLGHYPRWSAAARAHNWAACAAQVGSWPAGSAKFECDISPVNNAGVVPRNAANRALFLAAGS